LKITLSPSANGKTSSKERLEVTDTLRFCSDLLLSFSLPKIQKKLYITFVDYQ
jgi:hypothetical protein